MFAQPEVKSQGVTVMSPPAAQTADSIALLWNRLPGAGVDSYDVYADDVRIARVFCDADSGRRAPRCRV